MLPSLNLTSRQSLLWLDGQLFPEARYHNTTIRAEVRGDLDVERLSRAWQQTVADCDSLRMLPGERVAEQHCTDAAAPPLRVQPLATEDLERWLGTRAAMALGGDGFPWDASLLRLGPAHHVFFLVINHAVTDATSMVRLVEHLSARYLGREPEPAPPFREYLAAEARYRDSPKAAEDRAFWEARLRDPPPPLRPYGIVRADLSTPLSRQQRPLGAARSQRLNALGSADPFRSVSLRLSGSMVLATALSALFHRISGNRDFLFGVPLANRSPRFARTLGLLMEHSILRVRVEEGDTYATLGRRVKAELLEVLRHGQACLSDRGLDYVPLNVLPPLGVRFCDLDGPVTLAPATALPCAATGSGDTRETLGVHAVDVGGEAWVVGFDFHKATFDPQTRDRLLRHLVTVLDAMVDDVSAPVEAVDLLDEAERGTVLAAGRGAFPVERPVDVVERIAEQARRRPGHAAVEGSDAVLTYRELEARSNQLARRLRGLGVHRESRVGVAVPRGARELVALLATWKAGGCYVPVDPSHPLDRIRLILEDAAPEVLVAPSDSPLRAAAPPGTQLLALDDLAAATAGQDPGPLGEAVDQGQLAYILFTSGSTGRPKGVEVLRSAFANFIQSMTHTPGLRETDRLLAVTTTTFDIAGLELFLPLSVGATTVVVDKDAATDPRRLCEYLDRARATVMQATPATWRLMLDEGWKGDGRLRLFVGGEALNPELKARLLDRCAELWNLYGPTETTVWSTAERIVREDPRVTIGRPIDRTLLYVLDARGRLVPEGVVGELVIGGEGLARGYRGRPDLTAERFLLDPFAGPGARMYRTGDLGRLLPDGRFECLGRTDHQVKIRGFRIELGEIESVLRAAPGVRDAVVVADTRRAGDPKLVAYWVGPAERNAVVDQARTKLPAYMVPSAYLPLEAFPLNTNGKIDRKALPHAEEAPMVAEQGQQPRNDLELRLALILGEVLGVPALPVDADFFAMGGTSVLVIQARARIEDELGVDLPLKTFFQSPTVEGIARQMGAPAQPDAPVVVTLRRGVPGRPPLFCLLGIHLYQDVARAVEGDQPVVGIHVPFRLPHRRALPPIAEVARRYLSVIQDLQPHGPYHLAGLCFGGIVAYEAARQLEAQGEVVALVALFDSYLPHALHFDQLRRLRAYAGLALSRPWILARRVGERIRSLPLLRNRARRDLYTDLPIDGPDVGRALIRYQDHVGNADTHLMVFRAADREWPEWVQVDPHLGWCGAAREVSVHDIPCGHLDIVRDPQAAALAGEISRALATTVSSAAVG